MAKSTSQLTRDYIKHKPYIKECLKEDLINYSALARKIANELELSTKSSTEAILVATRRFQKDLEKEHTKKEDVLSLLEHSEIEIKNKILVCTLQRKFQDQEKDLTNFAKKSDVLHITQGTDHYTIITQEKYEEYLHSNFTIIKTNKELALIRIKSPQNIETTVGVVAFLTNLLAQNSINIVEFVSCWTETLFIIQAKDATRAMECLKF